MFNKRLLRMVPEAKKFLMAAVVLHWIALVANVVLFVLIGLFLQDVFFGTVTQSSFLGMALSGGITVGIRLVCQMFAQRMGQRGAAIAKQKVRERVYDKLAELGPSYREHVKTSEAVQVCVEGVEQMESYFSLYLPQLFYALLAPLTLFACLVSLSLPSAAILLACVPLIPVSIIAIQKVAKRIMKGYWNSYTDLGALFLESIQGLTTLKIYQADEHAHEKMNSEAEGFRRATMKLLRMQLNSITVMDLFAFGGAAAGITVVLFQYAAGAATFAATFTLIFLSAEFFLPLRALGSYFHTAMNGMAAANTMFELLDAPHPREGTEYLDPQKTDIRCRRVSYAYGDRTVLSEVDFEAASGSFVGITGESGSGKSTLAGIIAGTNRPCSGVVKIGDTDMSDIAAASLRSTVTSLSHTSYMFKGTIRSNLLMARPRATDDELWEALERCRLADFVSSSGGLEMQLAAEGSNLSGGQRQRLALARAILHDTPIIVFDEATSNIDAESENAIIAIAHELARTKTIIMISHRLSALCRATAIYVLDDGRVVEVGTHRQLLEKDAHYAALWKSQVGLEVLGEGASVPAEQAERVQERVRAEGNFHQVSKPAAPAEPKAFAKSKSHSHLSIMLSMVKLAYPLMPFLVLAIVLGVAGFGAAIFLTVFALYALLDLAGNGQMLTFAAALVGIVLCGVLRGPLRYGEQLCNHYLAFKVLALVRDRVFSVLRKLAPAKLEGRDKGNLVSLVTADVELLEVFYAHTISPVAIALVVSVAMTVLISLQSPVLGLLAGVAYGVIGVLVPYLSSKASGRRGRGVRDRIGDMNAFVLDSLRGLSETLQYGRSEDRARELHQRMESLASLEGSLKTQGAFFTALTGALVIVFDISMLLAAAGLVRSGAIDFGAAALAIALLMSSFGPVIALANLGTTLPQTLAAGARVLDLLDEQPQTKEVTKGEDVVDFSGASVRDVSFSYQESSVLSAVNVNIEAGGVVRIAGRSGSGKSTFLKLLMRFWDVESGQIEIADHDVQRVNTKSLREVEGFMTQDTHLFAGTIRENLCLAKRTASDRELNEALQKAALTDLLRRLPQGLDTPVGELGSTLSGGERQRLGLARIFLHDAPFVLLNEPTSNLDSLNEALIFRALAQNRENKTIVLVSHRASTAAIADTTYSVDRGSVS